MGGVHAQVYRLSGYYNLHQGHVALVWRLAGRTYAVSIHGFEREPVAIEMAAALVLSEPG